MVLPVINNRNSTKNNKVAGKNATIINNTASMNRIMEYVIGRHITNE